MIASLLRRALGPFREFGVLAGFLYVMDRAMRAASAGLGLYVYELMVQPITGQALLPASLARNLEAREIGPGHPDLGMMPARDEIKQQRFAQGAKCLGVYRRGALIGYIWLAYRAYEEDEVRCNYQLCPPNSSVFDFDLVVLPEYRMGIGFMGVWHCANRYLHEAGIRYTYSRLTRFNTASRRAHAHLGWKRVSRAIFIRAWNLEVMFAGLAPFIAVNWRARRRITLRLAPDVLERRRG